MYRSVNGTYAPILKNVAINIQTYHWELRNLLHLKRDKVCEEYLETVVVSYIQHRDVVQGCQMRKFTAN